MLPEPVLLDGGLATELEAQGADLRTPLWSAQVLLDNPEAVVAAHAAFFTAGASVATTASYQAPVELIGLSVRLARRARDEHLSSDRSEEELWVAGSVGPYGASLADGSEYRGDYGLSVAELRAWHRPRIAALVEAGVDVLALETIPTMVEVEALLAEVSGTGVRCWLSITAQGEQTRAGEPASTAFALARDLPEVVAVGVNCVDPDDVPGLLALAAEASGKPGVAYPNRGEGWDADTRTWTGRGAFDPAAVSDWVAAGARLVGGCCRVTPADIAAMHTALSTPR
ncbi:MAG TPA: homocysteine S-methyltransferase [Propionibacteriaceae bacterium]|jgi:homocysteine S-methyltransferase|nr:homocysteine S-methyltransferase [Propionibacteriaceae bacterium]